MKSLKLKSLFVVLLSVMTLGLYAQQDPDPHSTAGTEKVEVSYQDYLKMQEAYLKGKVSKEKLLKLFNQVADQLDEICHPQPKKVVEPTLSAKADTKSDVSIVILKNDKKDLAKN